MSVDPRLVDRVHDQLWRADDVPTDRDGFPARARSLIRQLEPLASDHTIAVAVDALDARMHGLGPVQPLADDPDVTEIMINADGRVWVERAGQLSCTDERLDPSDREHLARRLAATAGRRIDARTPMVDVRLADGSRLHAILPPLSIDGPCLTIRRFAASAMALGDIASSDDRDRLVEAVHNEQSILVAGGTSSGKTTLLNALAAHLPPDARVITIEDAAELRLPGDHVIRLETRSATTALDGIGIRQLVREALRMRPDRIICGEVRGPEALDLVQAMNTGHRGSMSTIHANSSAGALRRLETLMLIADADLPLPAVREQIRSCIDLVVHVSRAADGARGIREITTIEELEW